MLWVHVVEYVVHVVDVHCGIHTIRTMFKTERMAPVARKIKHMCPGASIEGWIPKDIREQQQLQQPSTEEKDDAGVERELTEEEQDAKDEREKHYPLSVTVAEYYATLDGEYEVERALDRELEGLKKKQVKKILKKRKLAAKKEASKKRGDYFRRALDAFDFKGLSR